MNDEKLLNVSQVAALLGGCHVQTVYRMAASGAIPSLKIGGMWRRFRPADVAAFVESRGGNRHV